MIYHCTLSCNNVFQINAKRKNFLVQKVFAPVMICADVFCCSTNSENRHRWVIRNPTAVQGV